MTSIRRVPTVGVMATWLGLPTHKIEYILRSRGIRATAMAGNALIYDEAAFEAVAREACLIDATRNGKYGEISPDTRRPRARSESSELATAGT